MTRIRALWKQKQSQGWTQQQLGERMGYKAGSARQSVSQFLKSHDPKASMIRRFADALEIDAVDVFRGGA